METRICKVCNKPKLYAPSVWPNKNHKPIGNVCKCCINAKAVAKRAEDLTPEGIAKLEKRIARRAAWMETMEKQQGFPAYIYEKPTKTPEGLAWLKAEARKDYLERRASPEGRAAVNMASRLYRAKQRATPEGRAKANEASRLAKAKIRATPEGRAKLLAASKESKTKHQALQYKSQYELNLEARAKAKERARLVASYKSMMQHRDVVVAIGKLEQQAKKQARDTKRQEKAQFAVTGVRVRLDWPARPTDRCMSGSGVEWRR